MTAKAELKTFDFSNPQLYNAAYLPLFANKSRFVHLFGSAGSGKSVAGCQKEVVRSFRPERINRKTLVVRKFYNTLSNSVYSQIKSIIYEWKLEDCFEILKSPLTITNKLTNVSFVFVGLDDVEKVKSIAGVDRILIEEATELTNKNELDQLSLRLRGFDEVQITLMYNPINVFHWINTEIHQQAHPDHFILKTTYKDNCFLDEAYKQTLENLQHTNPNFYKVYALGEWGQNSEGLIYPDYETRSDMPPVQYYGLDFGYNDPCALVGVAVEDEIGVDKKNLYWQELLYETHLTSNLLIERLNEKGVDKRKLIVADSSRPEMIQDIKDAGFNIQPCAKYKGSVVEGITKVRGFNLKIAAGSKNLFKEITNYSWKEKDGRFMDDEPADTINHLMDAGRYGTEAAVEPVLDLEQMRQMFGQISLNR